jgi:hypothetical protein
VTANAVCPGPTRTPLLEGMTETGGEKLIDSLTRAVPMRRLGEPEDVAAAVAFLASDRAGFITGQTLSVSGGLNGVAAALGRRIARWRRPAKARAPAQQAGRRPAPEGRPTPRPTSSLPFVKKVSGPMITISAAAHFGATPRRQIAIPSRISPRARPGPLAHIGGRISGPRSVGRPRGTSKIGQASWLSVVL